MKEDQSYYKQITQYYNRHLPSHLLVNLGTTPDILCDFGAPKLPLVIQQSTLTKCIRKKTGSRSAHNLSRNIIEALPAQIVHPIFLIQDKIRDSLALITNYTDKNGNPILIAIKLNETRKEIQVNEIKSIYGKSNLKEYLSKHMAQNQCNILDKEKAERLSRVIGLQLPTTLTAFSHGINIPFSL